jgi:16S rRNA (cytosine967-C5)-methyltransferase
MQEVLANHCGENVLDVGGVMVYATCSILKEESEDQVQKLIDRGNVETLPIRPHEVPGFEDAIDNHGWLRVLPGVLGGHLRSTDGFFVARLVKK